MVINKKYDTKAWIRIVEAFFAILIVLGAVVVIMSKQPIQNNIGSDVYDRQANILQIVSNNETLRSDILVGDNSRVNSAISFIIPSSWEFSTAICNPNDICNGDIPLDREVYSSEVLISSNLTYYNVKKLRFFVWVK